MDIPTLKSLTAIAPIRTLSNNVDAPPFDKIYIERISEFSRMVRYGIALTVSKEITPDLYNVVDKLKPPFTEYRADINQGLKDCFTLQDTPLIGKNYVRMVSDKRVLFNIKYGRLDGVNLPLDYIYDVFNRMRMIYFKGVNIPIPHHQVTSKSINLTRAQIERNLYLIAYHFYKDTTEFI